MAQVQASCRDICRHEHVRAVVAERFHDPVAGDLRHVSLQLDRSVTQPLQVTVQLAHAMLGAAKHDRGALLLEDVAEQAELQPGFGADQSMLEKRSSLSDDLDAKRIPKMLFDHPRDPAGHRRGRKHGLRRVGEADDSLDVRSEAGVKHLIRLVEDHVLDPAEGKDLLLEEVEDAPRRADDYICAALEGLVLRVVADTAVEEGAAQA